ncbi:MAG: hypothetical protein Q7W02_02500 [Candidatus Rokubacteria bacterium]|nr:hypothetical protein [Candidatus Rokubacteria bacterium]
MDTIRGPIAQLAAGGVIYQVTLASGMIVTNPAAFGEQKQASVAPAVVVSEKGEILSVRAAAKPTS